MAAAAYGGRGAAAVGGCGQRIERRQGRELPLFFFGGLSGGREGDFFCLGFQQGSPLL